MPDYAKTKIYYIPVGDKRYYGHTTQKLCGRKGGHVRNFKSEKKSLIYKALREANLDWKDVQLVLVEDFPCKNVEQARARERHWIEKYGTLNKNLPGRSKSEYREDNKQDISDYNKDYYANHRDEMLERHRLWENENKEYRQEYKKGADKKYRDEHVEELKLKSLDYYQENRDDIKAKVKKRYNDNREAILEKNRERQRKNRVENGDEIREYKRAYYEANRAKLLEQEKQRRERKKLAN
jgi:hypothetical protein